MDPIDGFSDLNDSAARAARSDNGVNDAQSAAPLLDDEERQALMVLAFLFFRMRQSERAARLYETLLECAASPHERRQALAGYAAALLDAAADDASAQDAVLVDRRERALSAVNEALEGRTLATRDAPLWLLKAQALWALGREAEACRARDEFLKLAGSDAADLADMPAFAADPAAALQEERKERKEQKGRAAEALRGEQRGDPE